MITPSQCRAARGLLDWTQQELAEAARIGVATIRLFEGEAAESRHATLAVLRRAFELAGVEFIDENGGKASYPKVSILKGSRVVFNIKGNDYRLIASVPYQAGVLAIRFFGTHAEYEKIDAESV
jgi:mRNA-degrading endonuclease HigB of HigAB toxin-antitoxin module